MRDSDEPTRVYSKLSDTSKFSDSLKNKAINYIPSLSTSDTKCKTTARKSQRQATWLDRTCQNVANTCHRGRIRHEVNFPETFNGLYSAKFSLRGDIVATGFGDGGIEMRNGETGQLLSTLRLAPEESLPIMCCQFHAIEGMILYASSACGKIFICNLDTEECFKFIEEPENEINTISASTDGEYLVSGGKDAALRVYDASTGKVIHTYQKDTTGMIADALEKFHRMRIFAAKFHKTIPELIVSGGWDDTVQIWDIRTGGGSIRSIKGPHICGDALDVHETKIITGSWTVEGSLQLWDLISGRLMDTIIPRNRPTTLDGEFLYVAQYFNGEARGDLVVTGGVGTGAVEVIDLTEKRVIGSFPVTKAVLTIDTHMMSLVFGGLDSTLRIAEFP
ncbi:uncharacterized protein LOC135165155 [Diachasmimorpha longicaudata]|uniref:uncharacterized protein LOC135165155 n=1 Tax=Diachasmimorpha longicaudata TaxID=58733 RepID=UPI0030B8AD90